MLTASYNTPASQWTQGIDRALGEWSKEIWGDANLNVKVGFDPPNSQWLAGAAPDDYQWLGKLPNGQSMYLPNAAARFQGYTGPGADIRVNINEKYPFSFGGPSPGAYSFDDIMEHELGHGLYMLEHPGVTTPYSLWRKEQPADLFSNPSHFNDPDSLMYATTKMGQGQQNSDLDREAMSASGIPTIRDDLFYLINGAKLDGGPGNDTAIWLNPFDQYNAQLTGIERLQLGGKDPLTAGQQDIYKLYSAGLGRDPDLAGFQYWNTSGKGLLDMATDFFHAPEFAQTAQAPTNRDYISSLYQNILGREPEQAGLDYWDSRTDLDRSGLLANIAVAPENKIDTPTFLL